MQLSGEVNIAAARPIVWAALNDPEVLARCIEGVETLTRVSAESGERFEGKMNAKVGPVRATFTGQVTLTEVVAPERYVLVGEGKGGVAGFAKGEAAVTLSEIGPNETLLAYDVKSSVGGKLAQLGARLIEGTAKGYAETFFARLKAEVEGPAIAGEIPAAEAPAFVPPVTDGMGVSPVIWSSLLIIAVLAFLFWQWN
jgi:carbon monoxide dehydrogenase subunit G